MITLPSDLWQATAEDMLRAALVHLTNHECLITQNFTTHSIYEADHAFPELRALRNILEELRRREGDGVA